MPFIEARAISKSFTSARKIKRILRDVTLSVEDGEFVSIVGSMGCGKSTFLSILAGLEPPDSGQIEVAGEALHGFRPDAAFVFQNYSLLPWFSAFENVRLAVSAAFPDWSGQKQRAHVERYLEMVGLGHAAHRRPAQLSGGMRQRVAIARAFAAEPKILFLDEPFGALDAMTRSTLQQELARMCSSMDRNVTTIMITNNVEEAILLSDRIIPMTPGPNATLGQPVEVDLPHPRSLEQLMHDEQANGVRAYVVERLTEGFRRRTREAGE